MNSNDRFGRGLVALALLALAGCGDGGSTGEEDVGGGRDRDVAIAPDATADAGDAVDDALDTGRDTPDLGAPDADADADDDAGSDAIDAPLDTPDPLPPVADAGGDRGGVPNVSIRFDGSGSSDPDGEIVQWDWDFGNGATRNGVIANYAYPNPGVFTVTLTVTDNDGLMDQDEITVDLQEANDPPQAIIRGPFEVIAGEENQWNALESTDDVALTAWEWDVGVEGVDDPYLGQRLDYIYEEWGVFTMTLRVVDTDGVEDFDTRSIDVLAPPVPLFDGPTQAFVGEEVVFDGTESYDPDAEDGVAANGIVEYRWEWDDGTAALVGPPYGSHRYTEPGSYDVSLVVTDRDGIERQSIGRKLDIFEVPNVPPTPVISADRFVVDECEEVTFDASLSSDDSETARELRYIWDFGDGSALTGIDVQHAWDRAGEYDVTLTAIDDDGDEGDVVRTVTVENILPTATFPAPSDVLAGQSVSVDASGSSDGCEGSIVTYAWDWGDGETTAPGASPTTSHTYDAPGTYEITLTVIDDNPGSPGVGQAIREIEVGADVDPVAVISASSYDVDECEIIAFDGSLSIDDRDAVGDLRYLWDFGDGTTRSGMMVEKAYTREGEYEVTLIVTDTAGNMGETSRFVTVNNIAPSAVIDMPASVVIGSNLNVDASASSDACDGSIVSYRWDWGDGVMSTGSASPVASHSYDSLGTYDVTLTVRDDGDPSLTDTATRRVNVIEEPVGGTTSYDVEPDVDYGCSFGLVNAQMYTAEVTQTGSNISVNSGGEQPGLMTGTRTGDTFTATNQIGTGGSFGCVERYRIEGTFNGDGTISFTLYFEFEGTCLDCINTSISGTMIPA